MLKHLLLFSAAVLCGCASLHTPRYATTIKEVDWPINNLQRLIAGVIPTGLRSTSRNGREMYSKYFLPNGKTYSAVSNNAPDRYFATVTVLGDQRPYTVEIFVTHENRSERRGIVEYVEVGHAEGLAHQLERQLRQELEKRREDRNIIDDFRVF